MPIPSDLTTSLPPSPSLPPRALHAVPPSPSNAVRGVLRARQTAALQRHSSYTEADLQVCAVARAQPLTLTLP
jgi:hypothetical protein